MRLIAAVLLAATSLAAGAAEIAGVKLDDRTRLEGRELVLNGAGLRKRFIFQVYAIGLYLPEKKAEAGAVLPMAGPKRVAIRMLRDVGAAQFSEALRDGMRANVAESEFQALQPRLQQLEAIMAGIGEAKKGMAIDLDWTGSATRLQVDGRSAGSPIAGEDFYRALLRIWLGDKPVQDDLKKALLGG